MCKTEHLSSVGKTAHCVAWVQVIGGSIGMVFCLLAGGIPGGLAAVLMVVAAGVIACGCCSPKQGFCCGVVTNIIALVIFLAAGALMHGLLTEAAKPIDQCTADCEMGHGGKVICPGMSSLHFCDGHVDSDCGGSFCECEEALRLCDSNGGSGNRRLNWDWDDDDHSMITNWEFESFDSSGSCMEMCEALNGVINGYLQIAMAICFGFAFSLIGSTIFFCRALSDPVAPGQDADKMHSVVMATPATSGI
jgi:hypothetical protein